MNARIAATLLAAAFALSACAPDYTPVYLRNFRALDSTTCGPVDDPQLASGNGTLDIAARPPYIAYAELVNQLGTVAEPSSEPGAPERLSTSANEAIVEQATLRYTSNPSVSIPTQRIDVNFVVSPSTIENPNLLGINLLPRDAAEALFNAVIPGDQLELRVFLSLSGRTRSGQTFTTNEARYSIDVFSSGLTCAAGERFATDSPCGGPGGQDGSSPTCVPAQ